MTRPTVWLTVGALVVVILIALGAALLRDEDCPRYTRQEQPEGEPACREMKE